jgi:hypothetical protein
MDLFSYLFGIVIGVIGSRIILGWRKPKEDDDKII